MSKGRRKNNNRVTEGEGEFCFGDVVNELPPWKVRKYVEKCGFEK